MTEAFLKLDGIGFSHDGRAPIFEDFSLALSRGESLAVIGPSGCGKSTLLSLVAGLKRPQSGRLLIGGSPLLRPRPRTGLVLQDHGLLPWATVETNIRLGFRIREGYGADGIHAPEDWSVTKGAEDRDVAAWIRRLNLGGLEASYPETLSRGQRQRAAIARTLVLAPDLLLMDEPFSALDPPIREDLQLRMNRLRMEDGQTSLVVTHDIREAVILGDRILVMAAGVNRHPRILETPVARCAHPSSHREFETICETVRAAMGGDL